MNPRLLALLLFVTLVSAQDQSAIRPFQIMVNSASNCYLPSKWDNHLLVACERAAEFGEAQPAPGKDVPKISPCGQPIYMPAVRGGVIEYGASDFYLGKPFRLPGPRPVEDEIWLYNWDTGP